MMGLLLVAVFTVVLIPLFYVVVGALSVSERVHADSAEFSSVVGTERQREATGEPSGGRKKVLGHAARVLAVFLIASATLLLVAALICFGGNLFSYLSTFINALMVWILIGFVLNPAMRGIRVLAGLCTALALAAAQFVGLDNWIVNNLMSLLAATCMLLMWRGLGFKALATLSAGLLVYDLISVYVTGLMVYVAHASEGMSANMTFGVPDSLSAQAVPVYMVGLGDVAIPGLWVMLAFRMATMHGRKSVIATTIAGIAVGWVLANVTLVVTQYPVPGLLFLIPGAACGYLIRAVPLKLNEKQATA